MPNQPQKKSKQPDHLRAWIEHPGFTDYMGPDAAFKLDVLAALLAGGNLSAVAARRGLSRQAAYWHARHARQAFGIGKGGKG